MQPFMTVYTATCKEIVRTKMMRSEVTPAGSDLHDVMRPVPFWGINGAAINLQVSLHFA